jgi:hypothetical protein
MDFFHHANRLLLYYAKLAQVRHSVILFYIVKF